jgi:hypothetical protein
VKHSRQGWSEQSITPLVKCHRSTVRKWLRRNKEEAMKVPIHRQLLDYPSRPLNPHRKVYFGTIHTLAEYDCRLNDKEQRPQSIESRSISRRHSVPGNGSYLKSDGSENRLRKSERKENQQEQFIRSSKSCRFRKPPKPQNIVIGICGEIHQICRG